MATITVYPTGIADGVNNDTDRIQNAINLAKPGDTILLKAVFRNIK